MSLRLKLLLWYTGVFAVSGALLTTTMYALVAHRMRIEVERDLDETTGGFVWVNESGVM